MHKATYNMIDLANATSVRWLTSLTIQKPVN